MNTLPFMHQTQIASSGSKPHPSADSKIVTGTERSSFEPVMRDAASRTATPKPSARDNSDNNTHNNNTQDNSGIARQEHKQSGANEDMAGAQVTGHDRYAKDRGPKTMSEGARSESSVSTQVSKSSEEPTDADKGSAEKTRPLQDTALSLTGTESEELQNKLKEIMQILEQDPATRKIAAKLQDILRDIKDSTSVTEALPGLNLSEAQTQTLQKILQGSKESVSITEALPRLNLSEAQTQTLQKILQGSQESASITEALPRLNLSEAQTQTLQKILQGSQESASITEALPRLNLSEAQTQTLQKILQGSQESASITEALPRLNLSEAQTQTLQKILQGSKESASITEALPRLNLSEAQTQTLQKILQGSQESASITEALPRLNLSEAQTQTLQKILQGSQESASTTETLPRLNLSETQAQKLQETLSALKLMHEKGSVNNSVEGSAQLKEKLTDLLTVVEQVLRRAQQSSRTQSVAQLKQPEVVEGFILRTENDRTPFNTAAKIDDPRFATLLNKTTDFTSLRERHGQQNAQQADMHSTRIAGMNSHEQAQNLVQQARAEMATANPGSNTETGAMGKGSYEGQAQSGSGNTLTSGSIAADLMGMKGMAEVAIAKDNATVDFSATQKGTAVGSSTSDPGVLSLKNGTTMPSARVVDQTIQHLNLHARGDSSVVTVKLYPEELGELNIRMVMEGDQLKLQIQAQNQQVREILEQNFPRLRTAMEDQGVTVEDFQVSLGDSEAGDQAGTQRDDELPRHRGADGTVGTAEFDAEESENMDTPRRAASPGGLSLHV